MRRVFECRFTRTSIIRWLAIATITALILPATGCKGKDPEPARPKVTRPRLPVYGEPSK
jgi:hypothetical protein